MRCVSSALGISGSLPKLPMDAFLFSTGWHQRSLRFHECIFTVCSCGGVERHWRRGAGPSKERHCGSFSFLGVLLIGSQLLMLGKKRTKWLMCTLTKWCILTLQNWKESHSFKSDPKSFLPRDESHDCASLTCPLYTLQRCNSRRQCSEYLQSTMQTDRPFLEPCFLGNFIHRLRYLLVSTLLFIPALKGCSFLHSGDNSHFIMHLAVYCQGPLRERRTRERSHAAGHLPLLRN